MGIIQKEKQYKIITDNIEIVKSYGITINGNYNAIVDTNKGIRSRGRSELLVINGNKVYLSKSKKGLCGNYDVPGGGWDKDEAHNKSAIREAEEESRLKTKNIKYGGKYLTYYDEPHEWVQNNVPKEYQWRGYYTEVYVGEYAGKYNGKIDDKDKDDIIDTGKFYNIEDVFDELHPVHQKAIKDYLSNYSNMPSASEKDPFHETYYGKVFDIEESKDASTIDASFKKKNGKSFKYMQFPGAEAEKYMSKDNHWNKESIDDFKTRKMGEIAVNVKNDEVAGWIFVNASGTIGPLRVYDDYRGYGISNTLVDDAINKYHGKELGVYKDNEVALKLYEKHGFKTYRTKKYKDGTEVYIMKLSKNNGINESVVQEAIKLPITLYHGSVMLYDELKSTGIDLGNAIQKPGWSLFCWTKYDYAIGWGVFGVLKKLAKNYDDINVLCCGNSHIPYITKSSYEKLINVLQSIPDNLKTYYVYTIKPDKKYEYGFGHSSNTPNCITIRNCSIKPYKVDKRVLSINDLQKYCKIVPDDYEPTKDDNGFDKRILSFLMTNDYTRNFKNKKQLSNDIEKGLLQVGDDIQEYMDRNGIELNKVSIYDRFKNESVVQEAYALSSNDTVLNFDKWKKGSNNILYVTGLSGSGKTTLGEKYEKEYNAHLFEIDGLEFTYDSTNTGILEKIEEKCPEYASYHASRKTKEGYTGNNLVGILKKALSTALDIMKKDSNNLYIVEGVQIFQWLDPSTFSGKPVIIKGASALRSAYQRYTRGKSTSDNGGDNILKLVSWYVKSEKSLSKFKKGIKESEELQEAARSELPESEFGVPGKRKFPLDTPERVKSAIRFFNYVEPEDEAELAKRIKEKAKKFGVAIRCGKKNRLSKYITKEYVNEFMAAGAIGNDAYAVINGSIKQAAYQNGYKYIEDDEYPYTKKRKESRTIHKNTMMNNDFTNKE